MLTDNSSGDTFQGWAGVAKDAPLEKRELTLKQWDEDSVDLQVTHCGICGTDTHTLNEDWKTADWPVVVGHEIVGIVTRVGKNVKHLKVGDRAGVGAQSGSCHACDACESGFENICSVLRTSTYNSRWPNGDKAYGGYADKWRGDHRFVFKVPDNLTSEIAATFFCAGVTTFAPLKRTQVGPGSVVGVVGIGGLGHYGILWAKAMGAKVVGLSHGDSKRQVALELGCDDFIVMGDEAQLEKYKKKFTHILCTGTGSDFDWSVYLSLIRFNGHFINVMLPKWQLPPISCAQFNSAQIFVHGSNIGSPRDIQETLEFAAEKNVRPWIQTYPMKDIHKAIEDFKAGKPRFRFVLEN